MYVLNIEDSPNREIGCVTRVYVMYMEYAEKSEIGKSLYFYL